VVSEFPHSNWRCVIAPRSCLLNAGGLWELSASTVLLGAATLVPFWLWRSVSQFRHSIVTALETQVPRVSIGRRACPLSLFWLGERVRCQWASDPGACRTSTPATQPSCHSSHTALRATPPIVKRRTKPTILRAEGGRLHGRVGWPPWEDLGLALG
jgi:hypothetical protein